jgi:hypothetical protein
MLIDGEILDADAPSASHGDRGRTLEFGVGPSAPGLFQKPTLDAAPGDRPYGLGRIVLAIAHPRRTVTGLIADDATNIVEQGLFVLGSQQGLVALADGFQFTMQPAL